ncbi:MAG TPA: hypothetical protein VHX38_31735 [Pseudonocardiaceae bacterium]|nr:hypothetical protein [Pseudonocardiaceae bacterium]
MHKGDGEYEAAVRLTLALLHEAVRRHENDQAAFVTYKQLSEHLAEHDVDLPYYGGLMPDVLADASRSYCQELWIKIFKRLPHPVVQQGRR